MGDSSGKRPPVRGRFRASVANDANGRADVPTEAFIIAISVRRGSQVWPRGGLWCRIGLGAIGVLLGGIGYTIRGRQHTLAHHTPLDGRRRRAAVRTRRTLVFLGVLHFLAPARIFLRLL